MPGEQDGGRRGGPPTAHVAYQAAKDRRKAATQARGTDPAEIKRRAEERLRPCEEPLLEAEGALTQRRRVPREGQEPSGTRADGTEDRS